LERGTRRSERGTKEIWNFGEPTIASSVILPNAAARRNDANNETSNLPDYMNRSRQLLNLECLAGLCRWSDRLVGLAVVYCGGHDPG
jgi:hypothetical protein